MQASQSALHAAILLKYNPVTLSTLYCRERTLHNIELAMTLSALI